MNQWVLYVYIITSTVRLHHASAPMSWDACQRALREVRMEMATHGGEDDGSGAATFCSIPRDD